MFFFLLNINQTFAHFQSGPPIHQPTLEQAAAGCKSVSRLYHTGKKVQHVYVTGVDLCIAGMFWNKADGFLDLLTTLLNEEPNYQEDD